MPLGVPSSVVMSSAVEEVNPNKAEVAAPEFIYHQARIDGRECESITLPGFLPSRCIGSMMRPPTLELGLLPQKDGSARLGFGDTEVLVGVNGPVENRYSRGVSKQQWCRGIGQIPVGSEHTWVPAGCDRAKSFWYANC